MQPIYIPQGIGLLVPPEELKARLDNITAQYEACRERLAIAVSLLTAAQLAEYKERVEHEKQRNNG